MLPKMIMHRYSNVFVPFKDELFLEDFGDVFSMLGFMILSNVTELNIFLLFRNIPQLNHIKKKQKRKTSPVLFFFFKYFWRTIVLFWGHWYPCFGFLVTSPLGFKARVGCLIRIAEANVMYVP